jgi:hypothetical protein
LARHHLQVLSDNSGLQLPVSHWPQPLAAVEQALQNVTYAPQWSQSQEMVWREIRKVKTQPALALQLRSHAEGLTGFDESYTPGSSVQLTTDEGRWQLGAITTALKLGVRLELNSNSLLSDASGTTWLPQAMASISAPGKPSCLEDSTNTEQRRIQA